MTKIKFGTDGWRSVIADGFTYDNVARLAHATCQVLRKTSKSRLIVVGYDHRFLSEQFALTAAQVAAGNRFKVEMSNQPVTSPVLSHQTKLRKAAIGIMITASHNPYYFNGFKLKGPHGCSVDESLTRAIEEELDRTDVLMGAAPQKRIDFVSPYLKWLKKQVRVSAGKLKGAVLFDGMHGPGGLVFEKCLGSPKNVIVMRRESDPFFGGVNPEPIETNLDVLKEAVIRKKAMVGIAVDGDADRVALVDNRGTYIPPHTAMPLLLQHLIQNRKLKGKVVQTVSMGYLPGRIANEFKLSSEEVPVGFKHIAARMKKEKVLFGGEESGGFGVGLWSPERDGLLCALLVLEILQKSKTSLSDLIRQLYQRYGESHFQRVDFPLKNPVDKTAWTERIANHIGAKLASQPVKNVNTTDGIKVTLEDDSWVLMRPSGTEPLIRTYSEATSTKGVKELLTEAERLIHLPPPRPPRGSGREKRKKNEDKAKRASVKLKR